MISNRDSAKTRVLSWKIYIEEKGSTELGMSGQGERWKEHTAPQHLLQLPQSRMAPAWLICVPTHRNLDTPQLQITHLPVTFPGRCSGGEDLHHKPLAADEQLAQPLS